MPNRVDPEQVKLNKLIMELEKAKSDQRKANRTVAICQQRVDEFFDQMEKKHGPQKGKRWTSKTLVPGD